MKVCGFLEPRVLAGLMFCALGSLSACGGKPAGPPVAGARPPESAQDRGAQLYEANCSACHGQGAQGVPHVYPALNASAVVNGEVAPLVSWIESGQRPRGMPVGRYLASMPRFGWLKASDTAALLTYLRTNVGNRAGAVSAADVERARNAP